MGMFTVIPQSTFEEMQLDAGVLLKNFNPDNVSAPADSDIICATTGGIKIDIKPEYSDLGSDVDNCPVNMKELKHLDNWTVTVGFTALGTSTAAIKLALGAADISGNKVTPRKDLAQTDFTTIWWVGDRADGGLVAAKIINALSTDGFSLQTTKAGKGQTSVTLTGHVSISAQSTMPIELYSMAAQATAYTYTAVSPVGTENPQTQGWYVLVGDEYRLSTDTTVDSNVTYYARSAVT